MSVKRFLIFLVAASMILALAACTRSLRPSSAKPTKASPGELEPAETDDIMKQLEMFVTQTAIALQAQGGNPVLETPAPPSTGAAETGLPPAEAPAFPTAANLLPTTAPQPGAAPITVPTATPGLPQTYILQRGEHPYCIARRFNVNPGELLNLSGLGSNAIVYEGMTLVIPQTGNPFPSARALRTHPTSYTVTAGETIYSIACQFGDVDPNAIIFANQLMPPYQLSAGQVLQIP